MGSLYTLIGGAQKQFQVAIHVTVPAGNNKVGVPFGEALIRSGASSGRSVLPSGDGTNGTIDSAERLSLADGTRYEFVTYMTVADDFDGLTPAQQNVIMDKKISDAIAEEATRLHDMLDYYGFARP